MSASSSSGKLANSGRSIPRRKMRSVSRPPSVRNTPSASWGSRSGPVAMVILLSGGGLQVRATPRGAVLGEQIEEGDGVEGLGSEDARARPGAVRHELERDDGVHRGLPHDGLRAVLLHG